MNNMRILGVAAILLAAISFQTSAQEDTALLKRAEQLHREMFSIDTHNDAIVKYTHPWRSDAGDRTQVTFPKMKEGGLDAALFAVFLSQGPRNENAYDSVMAYTVREMDFFKTYVAEHSSEAGIAYHSSDFWHLKRQGKSIVMFALENGYGIGTDLLNVERLYNLGVRAITLTHNYNNDVADSSRDTIAEWHGLSPFGYQVVEEMNRLGMIVDVSHTSTETLYDCLEHSKAPIIASHSSVRAIKDIPRNLTDEEICAIADKSGLIQVATGRWCLSDLPREQVNISVFCDHVDHVRNLVGADHVGIGTDFDGGGGMVGFEDVSKMKYVTVELLRRGWPEEDILKFWGENFLRVLREVEKISRQINR